MLRVAVLIAAAIASCAVAGCGPDKAMQTETARPGAYCQQSGAKAQTGSGRPVVCTTTAADDRLRWRSETLAPVATVTP